MAHAGLSMSLTPGQALIILIVLVLAGAAFAAAELGAFRRLRQPGRAHQADRGRAAVEPVPGRSAPAGAAASVRRLVGAAVAGAVVRGGRDEHDVAAGGPSGGGRRA